MQPYGALTLFFRWRKKSVQKKASGTATPGKSPLLPIFERGSSQCRAQHSWTANIYVRARSCSLFSSFKKGKAFSLRCLSPLCSPAVGGGHAYPLRVEIMPVAWRFCSVTNGGSASPQLAVGRLTCCGFRRFPEDRREPWHGRCHGDLCAMDTGNPTRIASREACRRAAVILRPACFPPSSPAPFGRGVGCRGAPPA